MTLDPSRRYPARPILAASIVVFREGRVLLAERVRPPGAGAFSVPGGLVEIGESLEAAALRELHEETGVTARIGGFAGHVEVIGREEEDGRIERHFVVVCFWGEWLSGDGIPSDETGRLVWVDPVEAGAMTLTQDLGPLLLTAAEAHRRHGIAGP